MENYEHLLAVLKAVDDSLSNDGGIRIFDLCITNKRLVIIKPKLVKRQGWRLYSRLIQKRLDAKKRRKQDPLIGLTIDELLKRDKSSYAIYYDDLDWIVLTKSFFGSSLNFKGEKIWKLIKIDKKQYNQLSQILPSIQVLKEKLEIIK